MNNQVNTPHTRASWTWADQFLTYRFWGLFLFYLLSGASVTMVYFWLDFFLREQVSHPSPLLIGPFVYLVTLGTLCGFFIAWGATRWKAKTMLVIAGLFQLVGVLLLILPDLEAANLLRFVGAILLGLGSGTVLLGVPAILANGFGGAQAFVVAFGMLFTISKLEAFFIPTGSAQLMDYAGYMWLAVGAFALALLGLLSLLPVKPVLFDEPPVVRRYNWIPRHRSPFLVALGSLFTPIYFYLIYKYHGEVASLRPSPRILSPWGAVGASFIPLLFPVMMVTLIEPLNERAIEQGKRPLLAPWVIFVWSILFYPQAMALIQSALNQSLAVE